MGITLAITPDGNRRWAKLHSKPVLEGHRVGINKLKDLAEWCKELGVENLLIWIFSTENTGREKEEVEGLFKLFDDTLNRLDKEEIKDAKIRFVGKKDIFPKNIIDKANKLEEKTKNGKLNLILLIGYGGRQEIVDATNNIIEEVKSGKLNKIDEKIFSSHMYAPNIPDPDIIIRTGEKRLSGLLPWQSVYSEIYFIDKLWPDFTKEDLIATINDYKQRERRFGK
jgi:undecaprenyl diphosphate synthase